jgi:hypothetical protein
MRYVKLEERFQDDERSGMTKHEVPSTKHEIQNVDGPDNVPLFLSLRGPMGRSRNGNHKWLAKTG